jgi:hypothetical protein
MNFNLPLALVWLLGAVVLFAYEWFTGDRRVYIRGTGVSFAWLLLLLGLYNLVRWCGWRTYRADQQSLRRSAESRRRQRQFAEGERREPGREPDPTFNFTDDPPPPADRHFTDRPPSSN